MENFIFCAVEALEKGVKSGTLLLSFNYKILQF